jgi:hypothetical protein
MLCSRCSEPIRPIVAIDIDGTLGEYHSHFLRFALGYMGREVTAVDAIMGTYDGSHSMGMWFCEMFDCDIRVYRDIKLAYRQGGMKRNMPVKTWASKLTQEVKLQAEVWLTTTRPYLRLDGVDPDTRFWLHHNSIYYDHLLYHEEKYAVLASRVDKQRVVAVVDDLPEELWNASVTFSPDVCILAMATHNRVGWDVYPGKGHEGISIKRQIDRRINDWYQRYDPQGVSEGSGSADSAA